MPAIKVENYQNIASFYNEARSQALNLADYYYQAALEIVNLQVFDPELDLLAPFYNAYLSAAATYENPPASVISAVANLQAHIIDKARTDAGARFANINQWYDAGDTNGYLGDGDGAVAVGRTNESSTGDDSIRVPSGFALWSARAGYAVDAANIS
ncbi:hypothetical protein LCGC14_1407030 [marine sediment metagenome]|uniref:Uncharacterized protein n=1 Tax=marine sediment metagenome TaxID=412755 RepID=A0A0F9MX15_9ZZZZ